MSSGLAGLKISGAKNATSAPVFYPTHSLAAAHSENRFAKEQIMCGDCDTAGGAHEHESRPLQWSSPASKFSTTRSCPRKIHLCAEGHIAYDTMIVQQVRNRDRGFPVADELDYEIYQDQKRSQRRGQGSESAFDRRRAGRYCCRVCLRLAQLRAAGSAGLVRPKSDRRCGGQEYRRNGCAEGFSIVSAADGSVTAVDGSGHRGPKSRPDPSVRSAFGVGGQTGRAANRCGARTPPVAPARPAVTAPRKRLPAARPAGPISFGGAAASAGRPVATTCLIRRCRRGPAVADPNWRGRGLF